MGAVIMNNLKQITEALERINKEVLNEDPYGSKKDLEDHVKHKRENPMLKDMSDDEFNHMGDYLYSLPVDNKNIFGYMTIRDGSTRYCKWDKRRRIFVCYTYNKDGKPITISSYIKNRKDYESQARKQSKGEIPKGK